MPEDVGVKKNVIFRKTNLKLVLSFLAHICHQGYCPVVPHYIHSILLDLFSCCKQRLHIASYSGEKVLWLRSQIFYDLSIPDLKADQRSH